MPFVCPVSRKIEDPEACRKKRASRPIVGMRDFFADCRMCVVCLPGDAVICEVEEGVPIPKDYAPDHNWRKKYPFEKLGVGASFLIKVPEGTPRGKLARSVSNAAWAFRNRCGHPEQVFTTRQVPEGVRVWRVK
jgi:hypothetical protein